MLALPGKPSIAVLKFANLSDDPDQVYFVDGLVEDLITSIALNRELFVISPNSTFRYAAGDVDVDKIGRELGWPILCGAVFDGRTIACASILNLFMPEPAQLSGQNGLIEN